MFRLIGASYLVVLAFLTVFLLTLAKGAVVKDSLAQPQWALLVALIVISPCLLPVFTTHVLPRLASLKISDLVEVSFVQAEVQTYSLEALAKVLTATPDVSAPEYPTMMTSYASVIIDTIKDVQRTRDEILVVDLREGKTWIPPNLYFLALLAARRTAVRQIAFVETRQAEGVFVGMGFPEAILEGLAERFPVLQEAARTSQTHESPLDATGQLFFSALGAAARPESLQEMKDSRLTGSNLFHFLGRHLHQEHIDWIDPLTEREYRYILRSDHPYVAAVQGGRLDSVVSRDLLALVVARKVAEK